MLGLQHGRLVHNPVLLYTAAKFEHVMHGGLPSRYHVAVSIDAIDISAAGYNF